MAHWFHRNPIKATSPVNFDLRASCIINDTQILQICNNTRISRSFLLDLFINANNNKQTIDDASTAYLALLDGFINPVDGEGNESKLRYLIRFRWTNTLQGNAVTEMVDSLFEFISINLNIALWYMKHATSAAAKDEVTTEEAKEVHSSLKKAAGIFALMQEKYIPHLKERPQAGTDLDPKILVAYAFQCTAEAQEVTLARAIELKHAPSLISELASETSKMFQTADNNLIGLDLQKFGKWKKYLTIKCHFYKSYAYCYRGEELLKEDKCGEAIRALQESKLCFENAEGACKEYSSMKGPGTTAKPEQHSFFRKLGTTVNRILDKCVRENGFIYHHKIPADVPALSTKASYGLVSPESITMPTCSPLWTPVIYNSINISATAPPSVKNTTGPTELPPVNETSVPQTKKEPNTNSGCVVS